MWQTRCYELEEGGTEFKQFFLPRSLTTFVWFKAACGGPNVGVIAPRDDAPS